MVLKRLNHRLNLGFFEGAADLKKYVFIDARKQVGQKMEGIGAGQF